MPKTFSATRKTVQTILTLVPSTQKRNPRKQLAPFCRDCNSTVCIKSTIDFELLFCLSCAADLTHQQLLKGEKLCYVCTNSEPDDRTGDGPACGLCQATGLIEDDEELLCAKCLHPVSFNNDTDRICNYCQ